MQALRAVVLTFALSLFVAPTSWALSCLTPNGPITATVSSEGFTSHGLERLTVVVEGFDLADFGSLGVQCTLGLGLESRILPAPAYLTQERAGTTRVVAVDVADASRRSIFTVDPPLILEFNSLAAMYGPFPWPASVAFMPLAHRVSYSAPVGPVELHFSLVAKAGYGMADVVDDLRENGYVANEFSVQYNGVTYLLWIANPFLAKIDEVLEK